MLRETGPRQAFSKSPLERGRRGVRCPGRWRAVIWALPTILLLAEPRPLLAREDARARRRERLLEIMRNAPPAPNPTPAPGLPRSLAPAEGTRVVGYDPVLREETVYPSAGGAGMPPPPDLPVPGEAVPLGAAADGLAGGAAAPVPRASATRPSPLVDSLVYPWNTIFKLLVRFRVGGTDYYYACSAFAAGSFHLVTAGHCVFNWDPNGDGLTGDRTWADEIWAWAAQTDQISPKGVPDLPYGQAKMVYMRSYDRWTQLEQFDDDWGVITLDRRDGDHTGWMGRDTATAASVHFSGYPVEIPYVPSDTLVQYSGFDVGNVLGYSCCRIRLSAYIYGGHSGGPSWRVDDATGDAFVEGIHSTSNRAGSATDTYLNPQKRADLSSFESDDETARPPRAEADLTEYQFDTGAKDLLTTSVSPGGSIEVLYNVFNSGFADSGPITVDFYLSDNDTISTNDTLIGTRMLAGLGAFSVTNPTATLTVPANQPLGTYYVGWIMSPANPEYSADDNAAVIGFETLQVVAGPTPTPTATATVTATPTVTPPPVVLLDAIPAPLIVGAGNTLTGSGFNAGSVIVLFVSTSAGVQTFGPYTPGLWAPTSLSWAIPSSVPIGNGFAAVQVVNTDQGYVASNVRSQLLYGAAAANLPTIASVDGVAPNPYDPSVPLTYLQTVIVPGSTLALGGTGFNDPVVNLFTAAGNVGPLAPLPGGTSTQIQVIVPVSAPTGPGSLQVVNSPFAGNVLSNAVSVPIGATLSITGITQVGSAVTVSGTGFSSLSVINLFNRQGAAALNLGGLNPNGTPKIPLDAVSPTQLSFTVPAAAVSGPAYLQVLNPPFVPFSSSGNDPDGAFLLAAP
jgi:V8-like Glu-specific endopeptidase